MASLAKSVSATRRYARFFGYPLDQIGLHRWLISGKEVDRQELARFHVRPSKAENSTVKSLNHVYDRKIKLAQKAASFLSLFPTVSLVCLTGSLAMKNAKSNDDIDLMVVTSPNTLWLTRLFVIPLLGLFFKRRRPSEASLANVASAKLAGQGGPSQADAICPNLWLDEKALAVPLKKRNLYTAHEVLQVLPLFDRGGVYQKFILANSWTKTYLANAYRHALEKSNEMSPAEQSNFRARSDPGEYSRPVVRARRKFMLGAAPVFFNHLAFKLQYLYMKKKITNETISLHAAYFHPRDLSRDIIKYLDKR